MENNKLRQLASEVFRTEISSAQDSFDFTESLYFDSFDVWRFILAVEEGFHISFTNEERARIRSVSDAADIIRRKKD